MIFGLLRVLIQAFIAAIVFMIYKEVKKMNKKGIRENFGNDRR